MRGRRGCQPSGRQTAQQAGRSFHRPFCTTKKAGLSTRSSSMNNLSCVSCLLAVGADLTQQNCVGTPQLHRQDTFKTLRMSTEAGQRVKLRQQAAWSTFHRETLQTEERPPGFVCDLPLIGSLGKIRYHRLEVGVLLLLTFHSVQQRLAVKHQTVF